MATSNIRGFIPVRTLDGSNQFATVTRPTLGNNAGQIFPGDVVTIVSGGVQSYRNATASGAAANLPLGVVARVLNTQGRPFTFNQPNSGPLIPTSTVGFVEVYENPHIVYQVNTSATAAPLNVGRFAEVRVCAPSTAVGRSGMSVTIGTVVTAAGEAFKVYNVSTSEDEVRVSGESNNDVEVVLVNGLWTNPYFSNVVAAIPDVSSLSD